MIDVILMGADVYSIFEREMKALDCHPSEGGFVLNYDFKSVPCHYARIPRDQVRFASSNSVFTWTFDPNSESIFHFLGGYLSAMNKAIKASQEFSS